MYETLIFWQKVEFVLYVFFKLICWKPMVLVRIFFALVRLANPSSKLKIFWNSLVKIRKFILLIEKISSNRRDDQATFWELYAFFDDFFLDTDSNGDDKKLGSYLGIFNNSIINE